MADKLIIAGTPAEAVASKNAQNIYMAGGTEVMRLGSLVSADSYVSIRRIPEMTGIEADGDTIRAGAACTFQQLADCELVPGYMKESLRFMASRTRRNMATIGGNIAIRRDDSFLIPTLIAASARVSLLGQNGSCEVSVKDYVFDKDKYEGLLITAVCFPAKDILVRSYRSANTAQSHARLTASLSLAGGRYTACAAVKNSGIYMLDDLAAELSGRRMSEDEIVTFVKNKADIHLDDDLLYGSADYRRYLTGISFALMYEELNADKNGKGGCAK